MPRNSEFVDKIIDERVIPTFDTRSLFDNTHTHQSISPIDLFFNQTNKLNTFLLPDNYDHTLANLVLLGYISAVESYFRAIVRKCILVDKISQQKSSEQTLTYGAATYHTSDMLPEALLEQISFANKKNIAKCFQDYLDINMQPSTELSSILGEFEKICQLRHCIVHRFSFLGSNNAMKLGLESHSSLIEKPIRIEYEHIQDIFSCLDLTVRVCNNFLFRKIITRAYESATLSWSWDYRIDKTLFLKYANIFQSIGYSSSFDIYSKFRIHFKGSSTL